MPWSLYDWGDRPQYPLDRRLGVPQSQPVHYREEVNLAYAGNQMLAHPSIVCCCTDLSYPNSLYYSNVAIGHAIG
jgi:hypothetical protein